MAKEFPLNLSYKNDLHLLGRTGKNGIRLAPVAFEGICKKKTHMGGPLP